MASPDGPRILIWDIENSPALAWVWGKYDQDVVAFERDWHLLTIAWKFVGDKRVQCLGLPDFPRYKKEPYNDYDLVIKAHELMSEADVIVAHNGKQHDTRKTQARMILQGLEPPSTFREIDTLQLVKRHFSFLSNSLNDVCQAMGLGEKESTGGIQLWLDCIRGDMKAWDRMKRYNRRDVEILDALLQKVQPWAKGNDIPNLATMANRPEACPKCLSEEGMIVRGYTHTAVGRREKLQCKSCGGYVQGRVVERLETQFVS